MVVVCLFLGVLLNLETSTLFEFCHKFCDGAQPSVLKSRNEWHSSWRVLVAGAVLRKLVTSVNTVVVAVTQIVLLHTQPVVAVPLTPRAWTRLNNKQHFRRHSIRLSPHFHSSAWSLTVTVVISTHLDRQFHSPWSLFPFTLIVISTHLDRRFCSPWSSFPFTRIVSYVHFYRHFHSPGSSLSLTLIVISIHPNRLLHSPSSSFPFNFDFIVT